MGHMGGYIFRGLVENQEDKRHTSTHSMAVQQIGLLASLHMCE